MKELRKDLNLCGVKFMINPAWRWTKDIDTEIVRQLEGIKKPIVHVCSGFSGIGDIRLDRFFSSQQKVFKDSRVCGLPNLKGDMTKLPIKSGVCGAVVCDPPYDMKRHGKDYNNLIAELIRVVAPAGKILFVCPWIIYHKTIYPQQIFLRKPAETSIQGYKILSISKKINSQLDDYR